MKKDTIFWDVDTQFDFMDPSGALYVPGAAEIIEAVSQTRRFALENGYSIIASTDWHHRDDPEISDNPDFTNTFPPHCMAGTAGSKRVGYLGSLPVEIVPVQKLPTEQLQQLIDKDQFHLVIRKNSTDVFENPNTAELVELLAPAAVVVFGVALDVCVRQALEGLRRLSSLQLLLVEDATKGLDIIPEKQLLEQFEQQGIRLIRLQSLRRELECGR